MVRKKLYSIRAAVYALVLALGALIAPPQHGLRTVFR